MKEITKQQKKFLEEYATSLNVKASAISAEYSEKIALKQGLYFLSKEKYLKALNSLIEKRIARLEIPKSFIIKKFIQLIDWASGESDEKASAMAGSKNSVENSADKNESPQEAHLRDFKAPKDPAILLRSLEGLIKFLEREKSNPQDDDTDGFSAILGVNCEKI